MKSPQKEVRKWQLVSLIFCLGFLVMFWLMRLQFVMLNDLGSLYKDVDARVLKLERNVSTSR